MRKRILQAILLAVAVTGFALGVPLGVTTVLLVQTYSTTTLQQLAENIATRLVEQQAQRGSIDLDSVRVAVPSDGLLRVSLPGKADQTIGTDPGPDPLRTDAILLPAGSVELSIPSGPTRTKQFGVAGFVLLLMVLSVSIGMVVATVTARRLAEPLQDVAERAGRLGAGDFRPDPRRHGVSELDKLAEVLDTSASALAQLVTRERELVGDVSHQLRSRLTALQLRLESLATHPDPETSAEAGEALEQCDRLAHTLEELLAAARAARASGAEPIDLAEQLPTMAEEWRTLLRAEGRALRVKVPDGLVVRATPARLREAIGVLLDNALQHGGGAVLLAARASEGGTAVIEVSDSGPGVPDELTGHIFERGVSGHGSTGVGLALARALVDADGGRMELATAKPATFALFLPVSRTDDALTGVGWRTDGGPR
ncbi:ATP-binding protein [Kutzneria viridogrisea]|uniref:Signal transduction histidine-protein kinase/phosphatase MprB n=2 Tax=Kutzneria TaxID=43356 RepID=W5WKL5_9PSEU|nr:ATP-binding protein [Kutzneria albida]AHI01306.1 hypothetical protein KALB_7948 [Kutzneria albida DSM 43870]MBA8926559.1 signal transduction histidine kinase [Kutzneria viridogrisea]